MFRQLMIGLTLAAGLLLLAPPSQADARGWSSWSWGSWSSGGDGCGDKTHVPELDPSGAGGAVVLLLGGVAYIASRRREEEDAA